MKTLNVKSMLVGTLALAITTLASIPASANGPHWSTLGLRSTDGTHVGVAYRTQEDLWYSNKPSKTLYLVALQLRLEGGRLNAGSQVQAILINYSQEFLGDKPVSAPFASVMKTDLYFHSGNHTFEGELVKPGRDELDRSTYPRLGYLGYSGRIRTWQELAIVVDGQWLTDPMNGTHNFKMNLGQGAGY